MKIKIFTGYPEAVEKVINLWFSVADPVIESLTQSPFGEGGVTITILYWG